MKTSSKITLTTGQLKKLVNEAAFDQRELRALANESQWMSIEEYVKKNDLDLDEFLGCASTNGEPMSSDAKLPIDELDYYASKCEKSSKGYKQSKIFVFGIQWDTHDETTNPLPCRAKLTVPTPNGKADKQGIHDYLYSIYKVEPLDFDWEDLTNDLPHGMFAPSWGEQVKEAKKVKQPHYTIFKERSKMKKIDENTKVTLTLKQLKRLVKESTSVASGPTCEESLDQIALDAKKAKEAYLNGENSEASDIVFKIIDDARKVSNRLTETTGGPLVENSQGLVEQVLEDPRVQMAAEQFVNCLIEDVVTTPTWRSANPYAPMLSDLLTKSDDLRWRKVVDAINEVKMKYKGTR